MCGCDNPAKAYREVRRKARADRWAAECAARDLAVAESLRSSKDTELANALRDLLSDLSETCWCAGWLSDCEFALWAICQSGPQRWGQGEVTADDITLLLGYAEAAGGWWRWDDVVAEVFVPMPEWLALVAARGAS
jgi:hypothetical protein